MPETANTTDSLGNLLIVDDDVGIRKSLARIMQHEGYNVKTAGDATAAIDSVNRCRPDLMLIDVRMDGIDGVETFQKIRADHPHVPAIFMTAYASSSRVTDAMNSGAVSVVEKPLDVPRISAQIAGLLGARPRDHQD